MTTSIPTDLVDYTGNREVEHWVSEEERITAQIKVLEDYLAKVRKDLQKAAEGHNGIRVGKYMATYTAVNRWREGALRERFPDLTDQFVKETVVEKFDLTSFRKAFPELAAEEQVKSWKVIGR